MILACLYALVFIVAVIWVASDKYAVDLYGFFSKNLHECARNMRSYWKWAGSNLCRLIFLSALVIASFATTIRVFQGNQLELGSTSRWLLLIAMLAGTAVLITLPRIADRLRLMSLIYWATSAVSNQFSLSNWQPAIQETWDVAKYETSQNWRAWHPRQEEFDSGAIWRYLVPVIYLKQGEQPSMVVPYMWEYFLAWNWPGEVRVEEQLPFMGPGDSKFIIKSIHQLPSRPGWIIIRAEMEEYEGMPIAE